MHRLDESFADGALELADETDASLVILEWSGPRPSTDYFFGSELDGVGSGSLVPTIAAHITSRWERVIVVPGTGDVAWHGEDVQLTLEVARRVAPRGEHALLVIASDEAKVREHLGPRAEYQFIAAKRPGDIMLEQLRPTDLVVAPAYLLPEMALPRRLRLSSALADQNLAIVAGPGRLTVARPSLPHAMEGILGQHG